MVVESMSSVSGTCMETEHENRRQAVEGSLIREHGWGNGGMEGIDMRRDDMALVWLLSMMRR